MAKVNILHLSDLHFGVEPSEERPATTALAQRKNTLDGLINELKDIKAEWKPDVVVISGDIGWKGSDADYAKARTWIKDDLLKVLDLSVDDLVMCAGNHDISRKYTKGMPPPSSPEDADDWLSIESLENFIRLFEGYNKFCQELRIPELSIKDNKYHLIGERQLKDLRFVVLNSAWFSREKDDSGKLWIGMPQIDVMKAASQLTDPENYDTGPITIATLHHPKEWLNHYEINAEEGRKDTYGCLAECCHVILSGHVHGKVGKPDRISNSAYLFKGGATYSASNYRNNFSIYQIDTEVRTLKQQICVFDPADRKWEMKEIDVKSLKKPTYDIEGNIDINPIALKIPPAYHKWIVDHCRYMDLKNLMPKGKAVRVELPEIFIPLYTYPLDKGKRSADPDRPEHELQEEKQKPVDIESLIVENDYLLIEGQAGSGKTTLQKHVAFTIINSEFDESLHGYLPVMIFLKEIQGSLENRGDKETNAIAAEDILKDYFEPNGLTLDTIKAYCKTGKAIFLIDGLDEMDSGNRERVVNALAQFRNSYDNCKMILSGRPHGIDNGVTNLFGDKSVKIHPLIKEQVDQFIKRWFNFVYSKGDEVGKKTAEEMIGEIVAHSGISQLTETPLMLTAICILYYDGRRLPDQRAELYNKFVDNLIYRRYPDPEKVSNFLNELAFEVHVTGKRGFDSDEALKVLGRHYTKREKDEKDEEYQRRLEDNKLKLNKQFEDIEQNCGLLRLENGKYDFWHLTIQEFLAARYIATTKFKYGDEIKDYWDNDWYKEVIRLLIGFLSLNSQGVANNIVDGQLQYEDSVSFKRWRLASSSLSDIHEDNRNEDVVSKACGRLLSIFDSDAAPGIKADAGENLGWLGDPRDLKEFILIEGGNFNLRSVKKEVNIESFKICKYPVTNIWYDEFIKASGYETDVYWSKEGLKWLAGKKVKEPMYWNDRKWNCPNSPVVGVSWYEAEAFTKWLTAKRDDGNTYRLPKENEWEAAAGGREGRIYSWGDVWDKNKCNNREIDIMKTSPVGIFESGNTPEGISDLSGNVWEWCMDWHDKEGSNRVLRGGSWISIELNCRSAFRFSDMPGDRGNSIGFRLVFVP